MVFQTLVSQNNNALLFKIKMRTGVFEPSRAITANDLHVLRWLRNRSYKLQTYYKLKRKN
jgi:hypothetical protein